MEYPLVITRGFRFDLDKFNSATKSSIESLDAFMNADTSRFITAEEKRFFILLHHAPTCFGESSIFVHYSYYAVEYNKVFDKETFEGMFDSGNDSELNNVVGAILARIADRMDDVDTEELEGIFGDLVISMQTHCEIVTHFIL